MVPLSTQTEDETAQAKLPPLTDSSANSEKPGIIFASLSQEVDSESVEFSNNTGQNCTDLESSHSTL